MIILGLVLLVLGYILGINALYWLGIVLLAVGLIFLLASAAGYPVGGRSHLW